MFIDQSESLMPVNEHVYKIANLPGNKHWPTIFHRGIAGKLYRYCGGFGWHYDQQKRSIDKFRRDLFYIYIPLADMLTMTVVGSLSRPHLSTVITSTE